MIATQKDLRRAFWHDNQEYRWQPGRAQNEYPADVRTAFVEYVDQCARAGLISEDLAQRVTL